MSNTRGNRLFNRVFFAYIRFDHESIWYMLFQLGEQGLILIATRNFVRFLVEREGCRFAKARRCTRNNDDEIGSDLHLYTI